MKGEYEKQILPYCICQFFYKAKERAMNKKRLMKRATAAAMCSAMAASSNDTFHQIQDEVQKYKRFHNWNPFFQVRLQS